jgi:hypothetical protein
MYQKPTNDRVWNSRASKWIRWLSVLTIFAAWLNMTPVTNGQASLSTLRGTVTDSSGAVVPSAVIVLTEPATGVEVRRQSADSQGNYELIDVKPGTYTLRCDAQGFKRYAADDVILASGDIRRIDISLSIGEATQQVTVMAGAAVIATETGMIGGLFNNQQHEDVPLVDIYPTPSSMLTTISGIQGSTGSLRINGQNTNQQSQTFDGLQNDQTGGQSSNPEFFQEISAVTVNAPADSPRVASYNMTSKRGENTIHGMAYYKLFSSAFDARNFFAARKTPYLQHEWQIEMGGPIIKNRTFIYGTWFSQRIPLGSFATATVPTAAERGGDLSVFTTAIKDPLTGQLFPGNIIPANRVSSVSAQFQNLYYPLPIASGLVNNYSFLFPFNSDLYKGDWLLGRIDHNISDKNSLYVRWLMRRTPYVLQNGLPAEVWTRLREHHQFALADTHMFSPHLLNTFRLGLAVDHISDGGKEAGITPPGGAAVLAATGLQGSNPGGFVGQGLPTISISGLTNIQNDAGGIQADNYTYTVDDSVTKVTGRHVLKFGGTYQLLTQSTALANYGSFAFNGSITGNAYADFLLGIPYQSTRVNPLINQRERATELGLYVEDTFKVNPKLTLEYGLRWDYFKSPTYDSNLMYNFDPATNQVLVPKGTLSKISPLYPSNIAVAEGNVVPSADLKNFRPRLSVAYRLTSTLVLRGGYGAYTERIPYFTLATNGGPFQIAETYQNQPGQPPTFVFPNPFPNNTKLATVASQSTSELPSQASNGVIHQFNITVEKETRNIGLRASYIGIYGRGLNYSLNINLPPPSLTPFSVTERPFPQFVNVTQYRSNGSNNYNAIQLEAKRRAGDFLFDVHYAYQRNRNNFSDLENPYDVLSHWTNDSATDRTYQVGTVLYTLPLGQGKKFLNGASRRLDLLVGNWQFYFISYYGSGVYFSPSFSGSSPSNTGVVGGLPDVVPHVSTEPPGGRTYKEWFNPAAFAVPPQGRFGNALPNSIVSQPLVVQHLSLAKKFRITERLTYTLTMAVSNLFNHPTFTPPLSNISVAGTGAFTTVVGEFSNTERGMPRQVTFKGRFEF